MARTRPRSASRGRSIRTFGATDHPFGGQALQDRGGVDAEQPSDWDPAIGDDYLFAISRSLQPFTQASSEVTYGYVHETYCTS